MKELNLKTAYVSGDCTRYWRRACKICRPGVVLEAIPNGPVYLSDSFHMLRVSPGLYEEAFSSITGAPLADLGDARQSRKPGEWAPCQNPRLLSDLWRGFEKDLVDPVRLHPCVLFEKGRSVCFLGTKDSDAASLTFLNTVFPSMGKCFETAEIRGCGNPLKPVLFDPDNPIFAALVLPMRHNGICHPALLDAVAEEIRYSFKTH